MFLSTMTPIAEEEIAWLKGTIRLQLRVYLTRELPALEYVTSVRAVLMSDGGCAVLRNADGVHVLPGGRREPGETLGATLLREIREETGCSVEWAEPFALMHFRHLTEKPPNYPYPYPDFVQAVFIARGRPEAGPADPDEYEAAVEFASLSRLAAIDLPAYQRLLVASGLRMLNQSAAADTTGTTERPD
jgi:ADP-ribose pyrophosphatase YjhB (NUDIX family)